MVQGINFFIEPGIIVIATVAEQLGNFKIFLSRAGILLYFIPDFLLAHVLSVFQFRSCRH